MYQGRRRRSNVFGGDDVFCLCGTRGGVSEWIERYRDDRWIDAGAFESRWLQPRSYCCRYGGNQSLTTFSTVSKVTPGKIQKRVLCGGFLEKEAQLRWAYHGTNAQDDAIHNPEHKFNLI